MLDDRVGYYLKRAQHALRLAMDATLRTTFSVDAALGRLTTSSVRKPLTVETGYNA
jgi:hypothetical protein